MLAEIFERETSSFHPFPAKISKYVLIYPTLDVTHCYKSRAQKAFWAEKVPSIGVGIVTFWHSLGNFFIRLTYSLYVGGQCTKCKVLVI